VARNYLGLLGGFALARAADLLGLIDLPDPQTCGGFWAWYLVIVCLTIPVMVVLARVVPFLVSVPLQFYEYGHVTTLDLNRDRDMELEERDVLP
jgi:hypothetical protein